MVTRARWLSLAIVLVLAACQGQGSNEAPATGSGSASGVAPVPRADASSGFGKIEDASAPAVPDDARVKPEEPDVPDPGKLIAELAAIPAWQAVIDRAQFLARRGQHGFVYGTIGPAIMVPGPVAPAVDGGVPVDAGMIASPYVWLVDDTEGNGTLGIRVKLGTRAAKEGQRVALGGAWVLDDARRWYWEVDSVQPLPPAAASEFKDPPAPFPSHAIANGNLLPGARMISVAKDNEAVYFQIVGPAPVNEGDGWLVANELGDVPFALLNLPGERPSYGGQDMRMPDERWQLKRGQTYTLRIGKIRKRAIDKPALINARSAPIRVM
jgi:hypothetical protein